MKITENRLRRLIRAIILENQSGSEGSDDIDAYVEDPLQDPYFFSGSPRPEVPFKDNRSFEQILDDADADHEEMLIRRADAEDRRRAREAREERWRASKKY